MIGKNLKYKKYFDWNRISEIENYEIAINSPELWVCHHRMEMQPDGTLLSKQWMIDHDIYFNLDPCMLIFMKDSEHKHLHNTYRTEEAIENNKWTEERKAKLRETFAKQEIKSKIYTKERNEKIRQARLGKRFPRSK